MASRSRNNNFGRIKKALQKSRTSVMSRMKKGIWELTKSGMEVSLEEHYEDPDRAERDFHLHYADAYGAIIFIKGKEDQRICAFW